MFYNFFYQICIINISRKIEYDKVCKYKFSKVKIFVKYLIIKYIKFNFNFSTKLKIVNYIYIFTNNNITT